MFASKQHSRQEAGSIPANRGHRPALSAPQHGTTEFLQRHLGNSRFQEIAAGRRPVIQRTCGCGGTCAGCSGKQDETPPLQAKLKVGPANDCYEREAERVADTVMRMPDLQLQCQPLEEEEEMLQPKLLAAQITPLVQRQPLDEEEELLQSKLSVQREAPVGGGASAPAIAHDVLRSSGQPLDAGVRTFMESRFGADFSRVRVHTGPPAEAAARSVQARAYTVGQHVIFGSGEYAPGTEVGKRLMAHELTHVVQQTGGTPVPWQAMSNPSLQRQGDEPEQEAVEENEEPSMAASTDQPPPPEFGPVAPEPGCPRPPTNLGMLRSDPSCPSGPEELDGDLFHFCTDSDVFVSAGEQQLLRDFARRQRADTVFTAHGYASWEGGVDYNLNLSCHRAKRVARALHNAGVPSQHIQIAAHGRARNKFGSRREDHRVVLISTATQTQTPGTPSGAPTSLREVVDQAVARLLARDYGLAADAYVSRWTCGRIPNLAEVVRRTTILLEGQDRRARINRDPTSSANPALGHANVKGLREIVIANEVFTEASDPVACAAARIIDLAFHHFVSRTLRLNPNDQTRVHPAALFLVELAGFPPCQTPPAHAPNDPSIILVPARRWWRAQRQDPLANDPTRCRSQPLPGPIDPQNQPAAPLVPPSFVVSDFSIERGAGPIQPEVDPARGLVRVESPPRAFAFEGEVTATGDPASIGRYEMGFLQTVVADETVVEYVGGQAVHLAVPVPMRDGPPRHLDQPPWYMPPLVATPDAQGQARPRMSDAPNTQMPYEFVNPELLGRVRQPRDVIEANNVVNRARVQTTFHTWLVARRQDAPLDRFNTHFLRGHEVTFQLDVDVVGAHATGAYRTDISAAELSDATPMQLTGPTPAELSGLLRTTRVSPPVPRAQAGGGNLDTFRREVRDTADDLVPLREALGLTGRLIVRVRVDPETGRLRITTPDNPTVTVEERDGGAATEQGQQQFADEMLIRLRKDLILAPPTGSRDVARVPIPIVLSALSSLRPRQGDENPFAPEHGIGLVRAIGEDTERQRSDEQLRTAPDRYDPVFTPRVDVQMSQELYCYDFRVSGIDIDTVCADPTLRTQGCVRLYQSGDRIPTIRTTYRDQTLGQETFHSPIALAVTSFPIRFVLYTPRERPGGSTFNHEMHHLIDSFILIKNLKERLARRIRARLMAARRLAADNPHLRHALLSRITLLEIVQQEEKPFRDFIAREFVARGNELHSREARGGGLPPHEIPPEWTDFTLITPNPGAHGSFTSTPC